MKQHPIYVKLLADVYMSVLRPLVIEKIQDTENKWDDHIIYILDKIFDYEPS